MAVYKVTCMSMLLTLMTPGCQSQLDVCGKIDVNTRTHGGQRNWPWQVGLLRYGFSFCGGSLINNQWVLTAAMCFPSNDTSDLLVYLGNLSSGTAGPGERGPTELRAVALILNHPDYNPNTGENDISLLKLASPVNFTDFIQPVCLAASNSTFHTGTDAWVSSFPEYGYPFKDLKQVELPVVGNRQCNCDNGFQNIPDTIMCAGSLDEDLGPCWSDFGGSLVSNQDGRWIQAGVTVNGIGFALPYFPTFYTRVSRYQSWISSQISSAPPGFYTFTSNGTNSDLSFSCPSFNPPPATTDEPVLCGQAPMIPRILGGSSVAPAAEWPWMVSLQKNGSHVCAGTLVAVDSVLSSANCFLSPPRPSEWTAVLGRLKQNVSNPFDVTLNVTKITVSNLTGSNVAVLRLEFPPTLSDHIQPICLDTGRTFGVGSTCWAAGWSSGQGGVLQEIQTSVVDCGSTSSNDSICTAAFTLEQGHAGGPVMCQQDGSWFQAAVLPGDFNSTETKRAGQTMVFEKMSKYENFLIPTLETLQQEHQANTTTPHS